MLDNLWIVMVVVGHVLVGEEGYDYEWEAEERAAALVADGCDASVAMNISHPEAMEIILAGLRRQQG
jgi:hypothetical protein